eukprot:CAMPEP_0115652554 /NCGR_PEP_ID=MMETSP0272-20121206/42130_1 /TAXON_ID=71861 /ORGANISM="Scrippsiella trochoidea, Strain CCMP3099" /LENGTH=47 /DNA_ID= /DNA_START= /DNA_END= /DNA_ORIENTATION=
MTSPRSASARADSVAADTHWARGADAKPPLQALPVEGVAAREARIDL